MPPESYDQDRIDKLTDPNAFRYCSDEELRAALSPTSEWRIIDFGSGTGLFTSELAPVVNAVFAVGIRQRLHKLNLESGFPATVVPLTANFRTLPSPDDSLAGGVSIRTYPHGTEDTLPELARMVGSCSSTGQPRELVTASFELMRRISIS